MGRLTIVGGDRGRWSRAAPKNRGNIMVWTARVRVQSPDRTRRFAAVLVSWSAEELGEPIVVRIRHATVRLGASCYCPRVEARGDQYRSPTFQIRKIQLTGDTHLGPRRLVANRTIRLSRANMSRCRAAQEGRSPIDPDTLQVRHL